MFKFLSTAEHLLEERRKNEALRSLVKDLEDAAIELAEIVPQTKKQSRRCKMAKIYYRKISGGDINPGTGEAWTINDVPARWRDKVQAMLEGSTQDNGN